MITVKVLKRDTNGATPNALRKSGTVPGVVYGAHHASTPIALSAREFEKAFAEAGEATIVTLTGLGTDIPTLIHEVDLDPITNHPRHVDFYAVTKGQLVEVEIPLMYVGEAPAAKAGANVVKVLHELPIKADPMNLPHTIEVDISSLATIGDQIRVADLPLPKGIELMLGEEEVVALVQEVVEEKEEAAPADLSTIEVEAKGKEVEEGQAEGKAE